MSVITDLIDENSSCHARIAELEARIVWLECGAQVNAAPVSEAKAQGVVIPPSPYMPGSQPTDFTDYELGEIHGRIAMWEEVKRLNAAPVQQGSVPDGYVLADKKALGTVLQALVNAPHHIRELQVTRTPVELFSDNPINVLIANYEAPAAPAADAGMVAVEWAKDAEEWGPALNKAGWLFLSELNEDPQKSALIFNNTKGPLRAAIMKYAEIVAAHRAKGVV